MNIGIIKETKNPKDNRVALTPKQIQLLQRRFPQVRFIVQPSEVRVFSNKDYEDVEVTVSNDLRECDVLFGIKEANINTLLPCKHYFFFGHIAKMQSYNRPLIRKMMELNITFTDYEYLVDDNNIRLCAFGWWAGVVGVYNTLRAYGIRYKMFELPKPDKTLTLEYMISEARKHNYLSLKIIITGNGRVSQGAQYFLDSMGIKKVSLCRFLDSNEDDGNPCYIVLRLSELVYPIGNGKIFDRKDFKMNPTQYKSSFLPYARVADVFISCHFWQPDNPVYLSKSDWKDKSIKIKVIGDVTCDIEGSIESTIRSSTHDEPFYDYNPDTEQEEPAFSSDKNITVMAVDTLPNALAKDTSNYFGEALIKYVFEDILSKNTDKTALIQRATILENGKLTDKYSYLSDYALK
ncbi:MAG: NAD(P)-dependent oxidoreductase [Bacteroidales bacterium]|jgi:alanine dehydrogenase|nr:NAD(P)-dependent oxidoreductase [Bacteroidales bacterium]